MRKITSFLLSILILSISPSFTQDKSSNEAELEKIIAELRQKEIAQEQALARYQKMLAELRHSARGSNVKLDFLRAKELAESAKAARFLEEILLAERSLSSEENIKEVIEFLGEVDPETAKSLDDLKESNPGQYKKLIAEAYLKKLELERRAGNDPERYDVLSNIYRLDTEVESLMREHQSANAGQKEKIRNDMRLALKELFDLRETERQNEVKDLEDKLSDLRNSLTLRKKNKELIVENRLKQLLGEASNLDW